MCLQHQTYRLAFILYGGGLRLNKVISMQVNDNRWDRNQMLIRSGKGNKDRVVMLSQTLKQLLRKYFNEFMPQQWLFEGQDNQTQYSERSVQNVVKNAVKKAGITHSTLPYPDITRSQGRKNNDEICTRMSLPKVYRMLWVHLDNLSPSVNRS
ncbi:MAG: tyrosine-type recombinase/integrase [Saprospiraceae bacterium]|nr:tyrosine-type recombinase/integrase [Saprospiraceae bacterium]